MKRLAIALVEAQALQPELPYDLVLFVTEGELRGHVLAVHPTDFDPVKGTLKSMRFQCDRKRP